MVVCSMKKGALFKAYESRQLWKPITAGRYSVQIESWPETLRLALWHPGMRFPGNKHPQFRTKILLTSSNSTNLHRNNKWRYMYDSCLSTSTSQMFNNTTNQTNRSFAVCRHQLSQGSVLLNLEVHNTAILTSHLQIYVFIRLQIKDIDGYKSII